MTKYRKLRLLARVRRAYKETVLFLIVVLILMMGTVLSPLKYLFGKKNKKPATPSLLPLQSYSNASTGNILFIQ